MGVAWLGEADPLVRTRVSAAASLFGSVVTLDLPLYSNAGAIVGREAAEVHAELWRDHRAEYGANVAGKLEAAMRITDAEVAEAERAREWFRERHAEVFSSVDLVVTATMPMVAPPAGPETPQGRERALLLTVPFNATGAPVLALPCGEAEHGLPASLQLAAPPGADELVLAAGLALEAQLAAERR